MDLNKFLLDVVKGAINLEHSSRWRVLRVVWICPDRLELIRWVCDIREVNFTVEVVTVIPVVVIFALVSVVIVTLIIVVIVVVIVIAGCLRT